MLTLCFKFILMFHKEIEILPYVRQLRPNLLTDGVFVQIVHLGVCHREQDRGMGGGISFYTSFNSFSISSSSVAQLAAKRMTERTSSYLSQ